MLRTFFFKSAVTKWNEHRRQICNQKGEWDNTRDGGWSGVASRGGNLHICDFFESMFMTQL